MIVSTVIEGIGLDKVLLAAGRSVGTDLSKSVYRAGAMLRTRVRAKASGRPGPRVQTGDYRRGISQHNRVVDGVPEAHIYSNSPQALRLEYGFVGTDALGRHYNQEPLPHWRPATEGMADVLAREAGDEVRNLLRGIGSAPLRRRIIGGGR